MPAYYRPDHYQLNQCLLCPQPTISVVFPPQLSDLLPIPGFDKWRGSEDCSNEHPLQALDETESFSGTSTPDLTLSPPARLRRRPVTEQKQSGFKSTLTASLRALKAAAQTVSNIATSPPLIQPDDYLTRSVFEFRHLVDRRPTTTALRRGPVSGTTTLSQSKHLRPARFPSPTPLLGGREAFTLPNSQSRVPPKAQDQKKVSNPTLHLPRQ